MKVIMGYYLDHKSHQVRSEFSNSGLMHQDMRKLIGKDHPIFMRKMIVQPY